MELLKMEGIGFSRSEIVTELSEEFQVTDRTVYRDYEHRDQWQPHVQTLDPERSLLQILNRYEQIYKRAAFIALQTENDSAKIGAFNIMLKANEKLAETMLLPGIMQDLKAIKQTLEGREKWKP